MKNKSDEIEPFPQIPVPKDLEILQREYDKKVEELLTTVGGISEDLLGKADPGHVKNEYLLLKSQSDIIEEKLEEYSNLSDRQLYKTLKKSLDLPVLYACLERLMHDLAVRSELEE